MGTWSKLAWQKSLRGQPLSPAQFMVLVMISTYADEAGRHAHPSMATLVNDTGMNAKTIRAAVKHLVLNGYLVCTSAGGNQFGKGKANEYRLGSLRSVRRVPNDATLPPVEGSQPAPPFEPPRVPNDALEGSQMTPAKGPSERDPIRSLSGQGSGPKNVPDPGADVVPIRTDVRKLCEHLRDRIIGNGSKTPTITKDWLDQARLLVDRDKRPLDEAHHLIDWCQQDAFWRSNILSMPKFRAQYDKLRLQATRPTASQTRPGTLTDDQWQQALRRAQQRTGDQ